MVENLVDWITKGAQASGSKAAEIDLDITYDEFLGVMKILRHRYPGGWVSSTNIRLSIQPVLRDSSVWLIRDDTHTLRLDAVHFLGNRTDITLPEI